MTWTNNATTSAPLNFEDLERIAEKLPIWPDFTIDSGYGLIKIRLPEEVRGEAREWGYPLGAILLRPPLFAAFRQRVEPTSEGYGSTWGPPVFQVTTEEAFDLLGKVAEALKPQALRPMHAPRFCDL